MVRDTILTNTDEGLARRLAQAEQALEDLRAEQEARFELAGVGRADTVLETGRIIRANRAFCQMLGYTAEELCQLTIPEITHPEERHLYGEAVQQISSGAISAYARQKRYLRKDGGVIWVCIHAAPLPVRPGRPRLMTAVVEDITAQRAAQAALNANAIRFRAIFDNSVDAIAVYAGFEHSQVNAAYLQLFGYDSIDDLKGLSGSDLIAPSDRAMIRDRVARRIRGEDVPSAYVSRGIRKDGTEFDLEIHASSFDLDGERLRLVIVRDVTERLRANEALRKAHDELEIRVAERTAQLQRVNRYLLAMKQCTEALVKAEGENELLKSICGILASTGANRFAWVGVPKNDAAKSVEPVAMQGVELGYLKRGRISWADTPAGRGPIGTAIRTRGSQVCEDTQTDPAFAPWKKAARKCGYLSMVCLPLLWAGECLGVICIYAGVAGAFSPEERGMLDQFASDLTFGIVALRARTDRERLQEELVQSSENERSRIGKDLHDSICQQLCSIHLFIGLIVKSRAREAGDGKLWQKLDELKDIVHSTLLETRMLSRGLSPIAIQSTGLVEALLDLSVSSQHLSGVPCEFEYSQDDPEVEKATAIHLYRIAQEAITNALKHSHATRIVIRLSTAPSEAVLEIVDNGTGMQTAAEPTQGMGLRTMNYRAQAISGTLEISPAKPTGTRVTCRVPWVK